MREMDLFRVPDEELDQEFLPEEPEEANEIIEPEEFSDYEEPEEYELESDLVIPSEEEDYFFEKGEKILVYSKKKVEEEKLEERVLKTIEIQEEVVIEQDDKKIILEKGDKIQIFPNEKIVEVEVTVEQATQKTRHGWLYNPKDSNFNFMPTLTYPSEPKLVLVQLNQDPKWEYSLYHIAKGKHILKKINYYDSQELIRNFDNIFPAYSLDVYDLWGLDGRKEFLK